jgi:N-acetylglutamate synthase-like GNAT family acetyltransferase
MEATKSVRIAQIEDADQIAACLSSLGYRTSSAFVRGRLNELAESQSDMVFVCEFGGLVIGVVSLHVMPLFHAAGQLVRITSLSVLEGWFRKGVGAQLVEAAERWAWSMGAVRVELTSGAIVMVRTGSTRQWATSWPTAASLSGTILVKRRWSASDCDFNRSTQHPDTVSAENALSWHPGSDSSHDGQQAGSALNPG